MRANVVRKKHVILDRDMAREGHLICKDIVVANHAIVRDVHTHHEKVARPDARRFTRAVRPVQRTKLANQIIVANLEKTLFPLELGVLRFAAHHGVLVNTVPRAQPRKTLNNCIRRDLAIGANFHVVFDYGGWMNTHLQGFENNRVLWILQILFIMLGGLLRLMREGDEEAVV